jgi:hypothetical protein
MDAVRGHMALFSRSFIRRRAISAATTILVSLASLALGHAGFARVSPEWPPLNAARLAGPRMC